MNKKENLTFAAFAIALLACAALILLKLCAIWLITVIIPAIILWWHYIADQKIETPQINSTIILSLGVVIGYIGYIKLFRHPGQRILSVMLPVICFVMISIALFLLFSRVPYSIYQLTFSFVVSIGLIVFLQINKVPHTKQIIGYIPLGRAIKFKAFDYTYLHELKNPMIHNHVDIIVADLSSQALDEEWQRFLAYQVISGMPVYHYLNVYESLTGRSPIQYLHENNLGALQPKQGYRLIKWLIDIGIVLLSLPIILPLVLVICLLIMLESSGGPIFVQQRVGQGGKVFNMYKFRSMYINAPAQSQLMTQIKDKRITKVGKWIRQWRVDELPQFINVLKGEMSLIGPRPELPTEVVRLEKEIPFYVYRQIVKPGISGWAQVMQGDGHVENIQTKLEYDFYYIKNFSFTLDFLIMIKTLQTILTGFGAR